MLRLHLVRHGETDFNRDSRIQGQFDSVLTDNGRQQAESLRPSIESLGIAAVYTSSNLRARQTTEILASNLELEVVELDDLREIRMGALEQTLWEEFRLADPEQHTNFMTRPHLFEVEGGERFEELQSRGIRAVEDIASRHEAGDVLVVSHGGLLQTVLAHVRGRELRDLWADPLLSNCSRSIVEIENADWRVVEVNLCVGDNIL